MGRYIIQGDLGEYIEDRVLVQLTDDDNTGSIDTSVVTVEIAGAEDEVDGYLQGRYTVPITSTTPGNIKGACVVLACRRLYVRRGRIPEAFVDVVSDTMRMLGKIAEGKHSLDIAEKSAAVGEVRMNARERVNTRPLWSGW